MIRRLLCLSILAMIITTSIGCVQTLTPRQEVRLSQRTFEEIVDSLVSLRKADKFDDDEWGKILLKIDEGEDLLIKWTDAAIKGENPTVIDKFRAVLEQLTKYQKKGGV